LKKIEENEEKIVELKNNLKEGKEKVRIKRKCLEEKQLEINVAERKMTNLKEKELKELEGNFEKIQNSITNAEEELSNLQEE
jgi:hypothetical protein